MVGGGTITTDVDALIDLLKVNKKISLEHAAHKLHVSESVVQTWVDFLLEEGIVGLEYNFVTPYIYLQSKRDGFEIMSKEEFFKKAKAKKQDDAKIRAAWLQYIKENEDQIHKSFFEKAQKRGIPYEKIENYYKEYLEILHK